MPTAAFLHEDDRVAHLGGRCKHRVDRAVLGLSEFNGAFHPAMIDISSDEVAQMDTGVDLWGSVRSLARHLDLQGRERLTHLVEKLHDSDCTATPQRNQDQFHRSRPGFLVTALYADVVPGCGCGIEPAIADMGEGCDGVQCDSLVPVTVGVG